MINIADLKKIFEARNVILLEYLRKSRADSEMESVEEVLERHENILKDFLMKNFNIEIPEENIYKEVISGGETIDERAEMKKLLSRVEKGDVFAIVVVEPQRLTRGDNMDIGLIERTLLYTNTLCITPTKIYDLSDNYDRKLFRMELQQGSEYLDYFKVISARGRMRSFEEGKFITSKPPLGYDKKKLQKGYMLVPNEDAQIVRDMFDFYIKSDGNLGKTRDYFSILMKKNMWTLQVKYVLTNKTYIGYLTFGKHKQKKQVKDGKLISSTVIVDDYQEVKGLHEPLISVEVFEKAQELLNRPVARTKPDQTLKNPLASILKCDKCGSVMVRNLGKVVTFRCPNRFCDNISSRFDIVEDRFFSALADELESENKYISNYEKEIIKEQKNNAKEIAKIQKMLDGLATKQTRICEFYENGDYTREMYLERINALNEEKNLLETKLNEFKDESKTSKCEVIKKRIPILKKCIEDHNILTAEECNNLLKEIVKEIRYRKEADGRGKIENADKFTLDIIFLE